MSDKNPELPHYWSPLVDQQEALMREHSLITNEHIWLSEQIVLLRDAQRGLRQSEKEILEVCIKTIEAIQRLESADLPSVDLSVRSPEEEKKFLDMMRESLAETKAQIDLVKKELGLFTKQHVHAEGEAKALHAEILALYKKDLLMRKKLLDFVPTSTH